MPGQGPRGSKHAAKSAAKQAVARQPRAKKASAATSPAYKALKAAGASPERLKALSLIYREGLSTRDLLVFAADLLYEAQESLRPDEPNGLADPDNPLADPAVPRAKALVQVEKALELLRKLVESDQPSTAKDIRLHVTIGFDDPARAACAGNGASVVSAADLPEPGSG